MISHAGRSSDTAGMVAIIFFSHGRQTTTGPAGSIGHEAPAPPSPPMPTAAPPTPP